MELASVRIFVPDVARAATFYEQVVGLEPVWRSPDAVVFGHKPMIVVERADAHANAKGLVGRFLGLAFATDDAGALFSRLTADGVPTAGPPERQPWGGILLHADDPAGNTVTFLQDGRTG